MEEQNKVQWVYAAKNNQELAERYDKWATSYDGDLEQDFDYKGPQRTAELFIKYVPKNLTDSGCRCRHWIDG
ncbi:hypothetical protein ACFLXF_02425 [Chloroflexota bacterium]